MSREEVEAQLRQGMLEHDDPRFFHGRLSPASPTMPRVLWKSQVAPRRDHDDGPNWLTATEWQDSDVMLREKILTLSRLLAMSRKTVLYTGAGISVAAGIGQAARTGAAGTGAASINKSDGPGTRDGHEPLRSQR